MGHNFYAIYLDERIRALSPSPRALPRLANGGSLAGARGGVVVMSCVAGVPGPQILAPCCAAAEDRIEGAQDSIVHGL